ncbi:uncharacterized protein DUF1905 [Actinocorallia herbida]|uniref:Uncharacterized protein DUF1905 n=1 Tax=Actinocorallia herbida TaxID=58109 RepID=A0A3N1D029_9ACTN|nr:DUF1905 domain-containing protein [Actinocorallia herbida]ROO86881.1 uncharacterized protein DUF1905 [Actinocorallia herbida]
MKVVFTAELWIWEARRSDTWTFVSLPAEVSADLLDRPRPPSPGFGALRVRAAIGGTTWTTSIFPDKARGTYVLPVKRAVRTAEDLTPGDPATVTLTVLDP